MYSWKHGFKASNCKYADEQYHKTSVAMVETLRFEAKYGTGYVASKKGYRQDETFLLW